MPTTDMPLIEPLVEAKDVTDPRAQSLPDLVMGWRWVQFWQDYFASSDKSPRVEGSVSIVNQHAAIPTTPIAMGTLGPGLYRISYTQKVTTPAGVNSSLTPTFRWTCRGRAQSVAGAAMTGNTETTHQEAAIPIRIDANTPITYETAYSSTPAAAMQYGLDIAVEAVRLDSAI